MKTAVEMWSEINVTNSRCIITGWSGRRNHQMTTTLQVEQAVNYRVSLKAAKAENQRTKTENTETSLPLVYSSRGEVIEMNVSDGSAEWREESRLAACELLG